MKPSRGFRGGRASRALLLASDNSSTDLRKRLAVLFLPVALLLGAITVLSAVARLSKAPPAARQRAFYQSLAQTSHAAATDDDGIDPGASWLAGGSLGFLLVMAGLGAVRLLARGVRSLRDPRAQPLASEELEASGGGGYDLKLNDAYLEAPPGVAMHTDTPYPLKGLPGPTTVVRVV